MRYRLRLHLQEIDLRGSQVVIGRGPQCEITIDDPMLSRRHARIDLSGARPLLEDLRSRNGTKLNGRPVLGRATLADGDRIRIGAQELVFLAPSTPKADFRTTSGLTHCAACAVPYPSSSPQCPHCGARPADPAAHAAERDPVSSGWTFHLLSQVVSRAMEQGRLAEAERMMTRGVAELDEQLRRGIELEPSRISELAECATRLGSVLQSERWLEIGARLQYRAADHP